MIYFCGFCVGLLFVLDFGCWGLLVLSLLVLAFDFCVLM